MAVYTHLTDDQLRMLLATDYDIGELTGAEGIAAGVSNSNYRLDVRHAGMPVPYILTLYEKRINLQELPFFMALMEHLASRGISCPKPIARRDGGTLSDIAGKTGAIISFLNGESRTQTEPKHLASVGTALAELHRAGADFSFTRANALGLDGWLEMYVGLEGKFDSIHPGLETIMAEELDYLQAHWPAADTLPQGVIHADLFPDNVLFPGDAVSGIIDFYFACTDALAYDLAVTLNAWCFERNGSFHVDKAKALMKAYQQARPLTAAEIKAFPILLRGATVRFLLTRVYDKIHRDPNALVTLHDPMDYIRKLEFHRRGGWHIEAQ